MPSTVTRGAPPGPDYLETEERRSRSPRTGLQPRRRGPEPSPYLGPPLVDPRERGWMEDSFPSQLWPRREEQPGPVSYFTSQRRQELSLRSQEQPRPVSSFGSGGQRPRRELPQTRASHGSEDQPISFGVRQDPRRGDRERQRQQQRERAQERRSERESEH